MAPPPPSDVTELMSQSPSSISRMRRQNCVGTPLHAVTPKSWVSCRWTTGSHRPRGREHERHPERRAAHHRRDEAGDVEQRTRHDRRHRARRRRRRRIRGRRRCGHHADGAAQHVRPGEVDDVAVRQGGALGATRGAAREQDDGGSSGSRWTTGLSPSADSAVAAAYSASSVSTGTPSGTDSTRRGASRHPPAPSVQRAPCRGRSPAPSTSRSGRRRCRRSSRSPTW